MKKHACGEMPRFKRKQAVPEMRQNYGMSALTRNIQDKRKKLATQYTQTKKKITGS